MLLAHPCRTALWGIAASLCWIAPAHGAGDVERGARASRACMVCHSFAAGRHMTGPSLAGVWEGKAGSAPGFGRYSEALKRSGIVWNEKTLDAWLRDPAAVVPDNTMLFAGIADPGTRDDLVAYLRAVSEGRVKVPDRALPSLRRVDASREVASIRYCGDAYRVVTGDGKTHVWWEFNLRFKTDGSAEGPSAGKPVVLDSGMRGDRASVVFAHPEEMAAFIRKECP